MATNRDSPGNEDKFNRLITVVSALTHSQESLTMSENIQSIKTSIEEIKADHSTTMTRFNKMANKISFLSSESRSNNIILFGLEDSDAVNLSLIPSILKIFNDIELTVPELAIADSFRLGRIKGNHPELIKFIATRWVKHVFSRVREFRKFNLSIANDRSKEKRGEIRNVKDKLFRFF